MNSEMNSKVVYILKIFSLVVLLRFLFVCLFVFNLGFLQLPKPYILYNSFLVFLSKKTSSHTKI